MEFHDCLSFGSLSNVVLLSANEDIVQVHGGSRSFFYLSIAVELQVLNSLDSRS